MGKKVPTMPESAVLSACLAYLELIGVKADRHNVMAAQNPNGQWVRCGKPGDPDIRGQLPDGRALGIETKAEGFDPRKLKGDKLEHFKRQLDKMQSINESNGVAFWVDHPSVLVEVMPVILAGGTVVENGDDWLVIPKEEQP